MSDRGPGSTRLVSVAVDAPGASGTRRFTYAVPERLGDLQPGEAVLVGFGRRQALGIVLGPADGPVRGVEAKADRGADPGRRPAPAAAHPDPCRLDRGHVPRPARARPPVDAPAGSARASRARRRTPTRRVGPGSGRGRPARARRSTSATGRSSTSSWRGPRAVRDLSAPEGRAGLLRRLRALATRGRLDLDWTLLAATAGPRYERWLTITTEGRAAAGALAAGERSPGRPLGPRQVDLLAELTGLGPGRRLVGGPGRSSRDRPRWPGSSAGGSSGAMSASDPADRSATVRRDRAAADRAAPS